MCADSCTIKCRAFRHDLDSNVYVFPLSDSLLAPVILTSGYENGSGPIFLDQLQCTGSEQSLLECGMGRAVGLHRCDHSMDVGIRCTGLKIKSSLCFYIIQPSLLSSRR